MKRPTSATVFGVLNIIFAGFGLIGLLGTLFLFTAAAPNINNPVVKLIHENPTYAAFMKISIPLGIISSAVLLASGIGLLRLKNWARKLSIGYAIYALVFGLIGVAVNFLFLFRPLIEQASQHPGPETSTAIGGAVAGTFGGCIGLIYPILLIIFMTRPKLVAAFQGTPEGTIVAPLA
ncbi:MAG TPA: hypothetical protein VGE41_01765 [Verrucomicrobiae bacterium]|jgi:hypothetical protein